MVSKEAFKKIRKETEEKIIKFLSEWDKSGYNQDEYRERFSKMSDSEFILWMEKMRDGDAFISFELDGRSSIPSVEFIENIGKKYGIELSEYVVMPFRSNDPNKPMVTMTKVPIIKIMVKRLQQLVEKKNSISGDNKSINPLTGQVTGNSKSAKWSNTQTYAATTTNQANVNKEFLGPRADDEVSKKQMIDQIEKYGNVNLSDLDILPHNKQSLNTVEVFLRGAGIDTDITSDGGFRK